MSRQEKQPKKPKPKKGKICTDCGEPMKAHALRMVAARGPNRTRNGEPVMVPHWRCP